MNNWHNDENLDQALFGLALEEPPADLRASILASTIYQPAPMFSRVELVALCAMVLGLLAMIGVVIAGGGSLFEHSVLALERASIRAFSSYQTLGWLAVGGSTAIWLSLFTGFQSFGPRASKVRGTTVR